MDRYGLGQRHFTGLLSAFRQDCTKRRYGTYDELLDYCSRSANPVGRLVLEILGVKGAGFVEASDCICTALQLANFWQDISVDAGKGRLYIPEEDLERFNVDGRSVMNGNPAGDFRSLVKFEVDRARGLMSRGFPLIAGCGYPGSIYLAAVWVGGSTILNEIEHSASTVGGRRPDLNAAVLVRRFPFADILRAMAGGGSA
jgi:phytoene/squalene synthetase